MKRCQSTDCVQTFEGEGRLCSRCLIRQNAVAAFKEKQEREAAAKAEIAGAKAPKVALELLNTQYLAICHRQNQLARQIDAFGQDWERYLEQEGSTNAG